MGPVNWMVLSTVQDIESLLYPADEVKGIEGQIAEIKQIDNQPSKRIDSRQSTKMIL